MHRLTKGVLKRPTTVIVTLLALVVFTIVALLSITMQLMPNMSLPYMAIYTVYPGAGPSEQDDLVAKKIDDAVSTIAGVKLTETQSAENISYVVLQFEYGTDMDQAYDDIKKAVETIKNQLPKDAQDPVIMEIDMNAQDDITLSVTAKSEGIDVLNEVENNVEPEFQKLSALAQITTNGGNKKYISVKIIPEYATQYGLNVSSVANAITAVNFNIPAGSAARGDQKLNLSAEAHFETVDELREVPVTTATGQVIHLSDVANISYAVEDSDSISRYNGLNNVSMGLKRKQSSTSVTLSRQVKNELESIRVKNPNLEFDIVYDASEMIISSLSSVGWTLLEGIGLSMLVLFIFFGDLKASLIVGSSMPISLLVTFIIMYYAGLSLNIITMSSLVIGIGMMVDNAIVVIEMCFRKRDAGLSFEESAYQGAKIVMNSIIGSTITTVVVYVPLAVMEGLSGQIFKPLAFTIIFAITSSLFSAITIIPFFFNTYKPVENKKNPVNKGMIRLEDRYGRMLSKVLNRKKLFTLIAIILFAGTIALSSQLGTELIGSTDEGQVDVGMEFRPNLSIEAMNETVLKMEEYVASSPYIDSYSTYINQSSASATVSAYKDKESELSTMDIVDLWNNELQGFSNECEIVCSAASTTGVGDLSAGGSVEIDLQGTDFERLKQGASQVEELMKNTPGVLNVNSSVKERGSKADVVIDPVMASAKGFTAGSLAQLIYLNMNGSDALDVEIDNNTYTITVEFPKDRFANISDIESMTFMNQQGANVPLSEMARVEYVSSPQTIIRENGLFQAVVTATTTSEKAAQIKEIIEGAVDGMDFPDGVARSSSTLEEIMNEEFSALGQAIIIAVFLVFMVMAIQFESVVYSLLIMLCIPFALTGSILLLFVTGCKISMVSLMGILMLAGIVVNNGIIFIDTANLNRADGMEIKEALIDAGKSRMRPIFMTTLTTILSMVPLSLGLSDNGEVMQAMGIVIIGGLIASTILTLVLLPTFYMIVEKIRYKRKEREIRKYEREEDSISYEDTEDEEYTDDETYTDDEHTKSGEYADDEEYAEDDEYPDDEEYTEDDEYSDDDEYTDDNGDENDE
ncbi:MAG: efflux RND transporter permease subunit [Lachnospiraceae bacterium]|nr:efflux RND transporter permease subunit [Lachnospiraceae bacterium]